MAVDNKIFFLILIGTIGFAVWTSANPPAGAPGTTSGAIGLDATGNITVNGKRIINLGTPASSTDAVTKNYVDLYGASSAGASDGRLWGLGRPGVDVLNAAGNCTRTVGGRTVKVSRGTRNATWDGAASSCPAGWWVCKESEIAGAGACGTSIAVNAINCQPGASSNEFLTATYTGGWLADASANTQTEKEFKAKTMNFNGTVESIEETCSVLPAWCCAYQ